MLEAILVMALLALAIHLSPFGTLVEQRAQTIQGQSGQRIVSLVTPNKVEVPQAAHQWLASPARFAEKETVRVATRPRTQCRLKGRYLSGIPP